MAKTQKKNLLKPKKATKNNLNPKKTILLSILAGGLLLVTNSAVWVNRQIFDETKFSNTVTTSLTSESSRIAIANGLTDRIFADRPIAKRLAGNTSSKIISGLLGTDQVATGMDFVTSRLHVIMTSNNREEISLDLTSVKATIGRVISVVETTGNDPKIDPSNIPDKVVLVEKDAIPSLYKVSLAFVWFAPIAFISALTLFSVQYIRNKKQYKTLLIIHGSVMIVIGALGLLVGPLFRPAVMAQISKTDGRVVVGNLYDAFMTTFNNQTMYIISVGFALLLLGATLTYVPKMKAVKNAQAKM